MGKRSADFRVKYRWIATLESVVKQQPFQHMRCDFAYAGDDVARDPIYTIHPEFEDAKGQPLPEKSRVPVTGIATMWILNDEMRRTVHRIQIHVGTHGYFVVGPRPIAEVEVIEILGLHIE